MSTTRVRTQAQVQAALDKALLKSDEQARQGNLPRLLRTFDERQVWSVASRMTGGTYYEVQANVGPAADAEIELLCECPSQGWCWHRTHVERAILGEIGRIVVPPSRTTEARGCPNCGQIDVPLKSGKCQDCWDHEASRSFGHRPKDGA